MSPTRSSYKTRMTGPPYTEMVAVTSSKSSLRFSHKTKVMFSPILLFSSLYCDIPHWKCSKFQAFLNITNKKINVTISKHLLSSSKHRPCDEPPDVRIHVLWPAQAVAMPGECVVIISRQRHSFNDK